MHKLFRIEARLMIHHPKSSLKDMHLLQGLQELTVDTFL